MASLIVAALSLRLMPALLAGLLIFEIVHTLAPRVVGRTLSAARARLVGVSLLALLVIGITIAVGAAAVSQVRGEGAAFLPSFRRWPRPLRAPVSCYLSGYTAGYRKATPTL